MRRPEPLFQLLHENLPDNDVVFIAEPCREHDCNPIGFRLDVHCLVVAVVNNSAFLALVTVLLEVEVLLKNGGEAVAF